MQSTTIRLATRDGIKKFTFTPALTEEQRDELDRVVKRAITPPELRRAVEHWAAELKITLQIED